MKIDKIELCNFGSYSGINVFDLEGQKNGNIVLIGGKNGAGKTTLFSGFKLCLYGYRASGFQNVNAFYRKEVKKFFNDAAKLDLNADYYVSITIRMSNGQADDIYRITRKWDVYSDKLEDFEQFAVEKNSRELSEDELADFDNYMLNVIPPELFNLFFFDGEQIADYFLGENGSETVKNAFMVLCGYDVFDIIQKNFKRIAYGNSKSDTDGTDYISAKNEVDELSTKMKVLSDELVAIQSAIESVRNDITSLDKSYRKSGGILKDEANRKQLLLKEEERLRDEKNSALKKYANEIIPYLIVRNELIDLQEQIAKEQDKQRLDILKESLVSLLPKAIKKVSKKTGREYDADFTRVLIDELNKSADGKNLANVKPILFLSNEEASSLLNTISKFVSFDSAEIISTEQSIEDSIHRTQKIREELERSNVDGESDYLSRRMKLEKENESKLQQKECVQKQLVELSDDYREAVQNLKRIEKKLDEELKVKSVTELSQKSVAFLDELQKRLYKYEIRKVELAFMKKIRELARKKNFIDKICIDDTFNVHIYKLTTVDLSSVCEKLGQLGVEKYSQEYGFIHVESLLRATGCNQLTELLNQSTVSCEEVEVLQEIEKSRLSKGEKQVFIMALYWALVQLSGHQVPFIIDTPFARIDSEHRANITRKFFMDLKGQVFIFSTNEEIVGDNYDVMKKSVQAKFLLENADNTSTTIVAKKYFGE